MYVVVVVLLLLLVIAVMLDMADEKSEKAYGISDLDVNSEREIDVNADQVEEQTVGDEKIPKPDIGGIHMEEGQKNDNTYSKYMNGETKKSFSVIPDKTSPFVQDNDKMIMTTQQDGVKTLHQCSPSVGYLSKGSDFRSEKFCEIFMGKRQRICAGIKIILLLQSNKNKSDVQD